MSGRRGTSFCIAILTTPMAMSTDRKVPLLPSFVGQVRDDTARELADDVQTR
jgi:hypothetical protein